MTVLGQEWMVATVGSLIAALKGLDPALPVGALRVERRREMTDFALGDERAYQTFTVSFATGRCGGTVSRASRPTGEPMWISTSPSKPCG